MRYINHDIAIPQDKRKEINEKCLYAIDQNIDSISSDMIFNSYTGDGGLHGLRFDDYHSFHEYTEAKKEIEFGQFFTPPQLCKFVIDCIKPSDHDLIADLTCGMGNFFNYLPSEHLVYGNEIDIKAYKIAKHLYPTMNIQNEDIRSYDPGVQFDLILGNPPFNLKWKVGTEEYLSQIYYCMKSHSLLKPAGLLAMIVPDSFLADDFRDSNLVKELNKRFNFIGQAELPSDSFKSVGVSQFYTKVMFFQKKSDFIENNSYSFEKIDIEDITEKESNYIYNQYIVPILKEKESVKNKLFLERISIVQRQDDFQYKVKKLLFDIKRNPKLTKDFALAEEHVHRFLNQKRPEKMDYKEWENVKLTEEKVLSYLKEIVSSQHDIQKDEIRLVKTAYGLKLKPYSLKAKRQLSKVNGPKYYSFNDMIIEGCYPFNDSTYQHLVKKKEKQFLNQSRELGSMQESEEVSAFLDNLVIHDKENNQEIRLNNIQKTDTNKKLQKRYGYLQWGTGAGKSLSAIAQIIYRQKNNNIRNVFLVAPAIAINNNWDDILKAYELDYIRINTLADINSIQPGQIVIATFGMLNKYQRFIKKYIRSQGKKVMFVLDEADNICNPQSTRTKAVLNCFRRVKYKLLMSATSTRNSIVESFTAFEIMYNNSINMLCEARMIHVENTKTKKIEERFNEYYNCPFPAYSKGYTLFKRSFSPGKVTVFGIGKRTQDIYNKEALIRLINKTFITRSFEEVSQKDIYKIIQNKCRFNRSEEDLYRVIIEEFYRLSYMFRSTGNYRKDAILKILNQLNALLKSCVIPHTFQEYSSQVLPSKAYEMFELVKKWDDEIVAIGCKHIKTVDHYARLLKEKFPHRPVFIIVGERCTFRKRKEIIGRLKASGNGILICTQDSLPSSMNIDFVNRVLIIELKYNFPSMQQFFGRFVRFTSTDQKEIHFLTIENSIESNLLKLIMAKEKLNLFMKNDDVDDEEIYERFGVHFDILSMLMTKEIDTEGHSYIRWGSQAVNN